MKLTKLVTLLFFSSVLLSASCKKDETDDGLPMATQTGTGMMAAKVNGLIWVKKSCAACIGGGSGLEVNFSTEGTFAGFFTINGQQDRTYIAFSISNLDRTGVYNFNNKGVNFVLGSYLNIDNTPSHGNLNYYNTNEKNTGSITITKLDKTNKIISGTFQFDAEAKFTPGDIVRITDGRFDVKYL
jgi:hypothetical protein